MSHLLFTSKFKQIALVLLSLVLSLLHFGPLQGTLPALMLTVGIQVYLLGYFAARALGMWRTSETPVVRIIWTVVCGLGINIVVGAVMRLLLVPVMSYVIGLHVLMAILGLIPATVRPIKSISRQALPYYLLLIVICVFFVGIGWERNKLRFSDYPDQTFPVSLANGIIYQPQFANLNSRNIVGGDSSAYWSTDGLTYVFAAWAWASGATTVQLIWYALTPLFVWLVPMAHFAAAYCVTKRADTAAWATGVTFIFALTTINTPSLLGGAWMYGQEAAFQLTTLRYFSAALLLPLTLFVFFSCIRLPRFRNYLMMGIMILALALTHPRQYLVMLTALYAVLGLRLLVNPSKVQLQRLVILGLAILPSLIVPFWQYSAHLQTQITPDLVSDLPGVASISQQIIEPSMLLFHPFVILALIFSVVAVIRLRRSLAAQYIVATVGIMLLLSYVTPIFNIILRVFGSYFGIHFVFELFFILPIGLILGIAISFGLDWLTKRVRLHPLTLKSFTAVGFMAAALILLIEPFPIVQSARDQIDGLNQQQAIRDIRPFDEQLLTHLSALPVSGDKTVYLTSNRIASYVAESVPYAFTTGGREQNNPAYAGTTRFYDDGRTPWLDAGDIAFLQKYDVSYIVLNADNTRLPQLQLQPERFERVDSVSGYVIFAVRKPLAVSPLDSLFTEMNQLYQPDTVKNGQTPSTTFKWQNVVNQWQLQVDNDPQNDVAKYGLAFAHLVNGDDSSNLWRMLRVSHPEIAFLTEINANLLAIGGKTQDAVNLLFAVFWHAQGNSRVLTAKILLTEPFFEALSPPQLDSLIATADSDPDTWSNLMEWNHEADLRKRVALLMSVGRWGTAAAWLDRIPEVKLAPSDLDTRAALYLLEGNREAARTILKQAISSDWVSTHRTIYENDWSDAGNSAARMYYALTEPEVDEIPLDLITKAGSPFVINLQVEQRGKALSLSAIVGNFTPTLPPQTLTVQVISQDRKTVYGEAHFGVDVPAGSLQNVTIPVELVADIPAQTPAVVVIQLQYSGDVVYQTTEIKTQLGE
ncbi:MAG: hypothetical protein GC179_30000 [Anaerolineaceae bacterium]|nr:hypothetical protein [Anaerolineaceae bacterium]